MIIIPTEKRIDWANPPFVLFMIVALNVLVFLSYQSRDSELAENAAELYIGFDLIDTELVAYKVYWSLSYDDEFDNDDLNYPGWLAAQMLFDPEFRQFLAENHTDYIATDIRDEWQKQRHQVDTLADKISYQAFGLVPQRMTIASVFSHQFLHGSFEHLFGNMVFLLLVGFAVEAALGHFRFLVYYLLGGVGSGLFYGGGELFFGAGSIGLVGASGAISGVMAMYVALFRLKKIEFFYWFLVFTGYFRAAALIILPLYLAIEGFWLFYYEDSNVAYTAHIGGFLMGGALILATQAFRKNAIDTNYLEENQKIDPYRQALDSMYQAIGEYEFLSAFAKNKAMQKIYGGTPEIVETQYNLLSAIDPVKAQQFLINRLGKTVNNRRIVQAQAMMWQAMDEQTRENLTLDQQVTLAGDVLDIQYVHIAEEIRSRLLKKSNACTQAAILTRRLAIYYRAHRQEDVAQRYEKLAHDMMNQPSPDPTNTTFT